MQRADLMALDTKNKNVFSEYKQNETSFFHARVEQSWELTLNVLSSWWQAWARPGQQASSWRQSLKRIINVSGYLILEDNLEKRSFLLLFNRQK